MVDVIVVGGGPTGVMLAGELRLQGEVAAVVAEVRKTHKGFGVGPLAEGRYRVVVPAGGGPGRGVPPTLEEVNSSCGWSPGPTLGCIRRAGCRASATPPGWPSATGQAGCWWPATPPCPPAAGRPGPQPRLQDAFNLGWNWPPTSTAGHRRGCWTATTRPQPGTGPARGAAATRRPPGLDRPRPDRPVGGQVLEVRPADPADLDKGAGLLGDLTGGQATIDHDVRLIGVPMPDTARLPVAVRRLDEAGIAVVDLALRRPSLDEVFLALTGRPVETEPPDHRQQPEGSAA